jgi:hypothetical protein
MRAAQRRAATLLAGVLCSLTTIACAEQRAAPRPAVREVCAPVPPCPTWVTAFRESRTVLHVYAYDEVSGTSACGRGKKVRVTAYLDEVPVGMVDVPCLEPALSTPPSYRIEGPVVSPGLHELRLDVQTVGGVVQSKTLLSLPAFDIPGDGHSVHMGAEVSVGIGPDDLSIGPPQVYAPAPP